MKRIAKLITLILAASLVFGAFGVSVYAENSATITVGTAKASAGETVKVDVSISDCSGFSSYTIHITYDSEYVTAVEAKKGINAMLYMPNLSVGGGKEIAIVGGDVENITENGVIATITFKIADNYPGGITEVPLKIITNKITEYNGSKDVAITSRSVDGKLIISGAGTVVWNGDTEVTPGTLTDEEAAEYTNPLTGEKVTGGEYYINKEQKIAIPVSDVEDGVKEDPETWQTVDEPETSDGVDSGDGSSEPAQGSEDVSGSADGKFSWVLICCIAGGVIVAAAGVIAIVMITKKGKKQE
ncbi:MAG: hypothetical protein IJU94_06845 [Clostridia bacterium]|nr:hypothetical protein [Clostridia bacterium]